MSRSFKIIPRYYDDERKLYKHSTIEFNPGITVLVGCNGSGKTTLLRQIERQLDDKDIPYVFYDNLRDGNNHSMQRALDSGNIGFLATMACSSEGERITVNLGNVARQIGYMVQHQKGDEYWVLLDAIDSGLSVDQVIEVKKYLFHFILEREKTKNIYIVCSANEYEMCDGEPCFNIVDCKYVVINSYEDYKKEVMKTRKYKDKW